MALGYLKRLIWGDESAKFNPLSVAKEAIDSGDKRKLLAFAEGLAAEVVSKRASRVSINAIDESLMIWLKQQPDLAKSLLVIVEQLAKEPAYIVAALDIAVKAGGLVAVDMFTTDVKRKYIEEIIKLADAVAKDHPEKALEACSKAIEYTVELLKESNKAGYNHADLGLKRQTVARTLKHADAIGAQRPDLALKAACKALQYAECGLSEKRNGTILILKYSDEVAATNLELAIEADITGIEHCVPHLEERVTNTFTSHVVSLADINPAKALLYICEAAKAARSEKVRDKLAKIWWGHFLRVATLNAKLAINIACDLAQTLPAGSPLSKSVSHSIITQIDPVVSVSSVLFYNLKLALGACCDAARLAEAGTTGEKESVSKWAWLIDGAAIDEPELALNSIHDALTKYHSSGLLSKQATLSAAKHLYTIGDANPELAVDTAYRAALDDHPEIDTVSKQRLITAWSKYIDIIAQDNLDLALKLTEKAVQVRSWEALKNEVSAKWTKIADKIAETDPEKAINIAKRAVFERRASEMQKTLGVAAIMKYAGDVAVINPTLARYALETAKSYAADEENKQIIDAKLQFVGFPFRDITPDSGRKFTEQYAPK